MNLRKYTPRADKKVLIIFAGVMWCGVGVMLLHYSVLWILQATLLPAIIFSVAGMAAAGVIYRFGFLRLAMKNLKRLLPLEEKKCLFSFMTWKSYLIVPVMVTMGIMLRHSPIPRLWLSIVYNGIGLALFFSGLKYITTLRRPESVIS
jgi:hypothetical protein